MNSLIIKNYFVNRVTTVMNDIQANKFLIAYCLIHFTAIPCAVAFTFYFRGANVLTILLAFLLSELVMLSITSVRMRLNVNLKNELVGNEPKASTPDYWNDPDLQLESYDEPNVRKA